MKKEFKIRLDRALKALAYPSDVALGTLIAEINKDQPQFSLRKILQVLRDGMDEGLFSVDGTKFRLSPKYGSALGDHKPIQEEGDECSVIGKFSNGTVSMGDCRSVKSLDTFVSPKGKKIKKVICRGVKRKYDEKKKKIMSRRLGNKSASENKVDRDLEPDPTERDEETLCKPPSGKIEDKRRRGPRCTSMKKEVKMPSRVHIPWTPQSAPQRDLTHNDLLRKSPDPMVGPLFDDANLVCDSSLFESFDSPFL